MLRCVTLVHCLSECVRLSQFVVVADYTISCIYIPVILYFLGRTKVELRVSMTLPGTVIQ